MAIFLLLVMVSILLSLPAVQTAIAKRVTNSINTTYKTNINISKISASPFTGAVWLKGIYIEDYKKDTLIYINELSTSILSAKNAINGKLQFGSINVEELYLNIKTYKGEVDTNLDIFVAKLDDESPPSDDPFLLTSSKITLTDGRFKFIDKNKETPEVLNFSALGAILHDFKILGPDVTTTISQMAFTSSRGIKAQQLATNFSYSKEAMHFNELTIKTAQSQLIGNLSFLYDREDFKDFTNKVELKASFKDSQVLFDEVNLFYNEFGKGKQVKFSADLSGTLNQLKATNLILNSESTVIEGNFDFSNLFDSSMPFKMDAAILNLSSNYQQLKELLPNMLGNTLPTSFTKFGQFKLDGRSIVTEETIDARINLATALGNSFSDLKLSNIDDIDNASYSGFVSLQDFDLGAYIDDKKLGNMKTIDNIYFP